MEMAGGDDEARHENGSDPATLLRKGDALLVVDVQPDFCPGGALPVEDGDQVVPVLNRWMAAAAERGLVVCASRDWHPPGHPSFEAQGGPWPAHCVQDTPGAAYHPDLEMPGETELISKGTRLDRDQTSAFDETGLATYLRERGVRRLWLGGLAEDVCVRATALDGRREGFEVHLIPDATRPVSEQGGSEARDEMRGAGVVLEASPR